MNLIAHGWFVKPDLVGLPERGDLGEDQRFIFACFGVGKRQLVETLEIPRDAATLQTDRMPRDFRWVRGKNGSSFDLTQGGDHGVGRHSGGLHADQSPAERAVHRSLARQHAGGAATALAVVGFGEVGEFEINGESLGDAVSVFDRQAADNFAGAGHKAVVEFEFWL